MPRCSIFTCKNYSGKKNLSHGGVSYHRFPQDPFTKEKWIDATGRQNWMPSKLSTICSEHFDEKDILISKQGRRFLSDYAVPVNKILIFQDPEHDADNRPVSQDPLATHTPPPSVPTINKECRHFESDIDRSTETTTKKKKLTQMLKWSKSKIRKQSLKIKRLQSRNSRLQRKIENMKDLLNSLQEKSSMSSKDSIPT